MSARGCWTCSPTLAAMSSTPPTSTPTGRRKPSSASCSKGAATGSCSPPSSPNQTDPGDPNSAGNQRKKIVTSIEAILRRLQTDHIDLYWVHARDVLTPVEELMRALDDQVRLGKVLYPAVSDWAAWEIAEANTAARWRDWSPFSAVQLRYNLLDRSPERELLPMADAFDLPVFAWGPLAKGRLTGKYLRGHTGRVTEVGRPYTRVGSDDIVRDVVAISHEIRCSPAQVAIAWMRQQPGSV